MIRTRGNVKMALHAIQSTKWRSFLTSLGIIIGVVSVVTTVSLGEGVKQQIRAQIRQRGEDLVTVLPGRRVERDRQGTITSFNALNSDGTIFNELDYKTVSDVPSLQVVAPFARITGLVGAGDRTLKGQVIASTGSLPELLNQKVEYGSFFHDTDQNKDFAIIGQKVAEELFGENVPIGKSFQVRDRTFIIRGVFEEFDTGSGVLLSEDYNRVIFIPYEAGRELMGGSIQIQQILAKPKAGVRSSVAARDINKALLNVHAGQQDFSVLQAEETLALAGNVLNLLTGLIGGIAAISLLVGGIGIMNIMLVAVSERTAEIGVRKAVGATNRQILNQFLTEAIILSIFGGLTGVLLSLIINVLLRIFTDLAPVITFPIMGIAVCVAFVVGVIFGVTPALRAARKDPIDALRHE